MESNKRKNKNVNDEHLTASYFYEQAKYVLSDDKIYDDFEKTVYLEIERRALEGGFYVIYPLKVEFNESFTYNRKYKKFYDKLVNTLRNRGFEVDYKKGNYIQIYWEK